MEQPLLGLEEEVLEAKEEARRRFVADQPSRIAAAVRAARQRASSSQ